MKMSTTRTTEPTTYQQERRGINTSGKAVNASLCQSSTNDNKKEEEDIQVSLKLRHENGLQRSSLLKLI